MGTKVHPNSSLHSCRVAQALSPAEVVSGNQAWGSTTPWLCCWRRDRLQCGAGRGKGGEEAEKAAGTCVLKT